ncbi:MAG: WYL domain-containing protein [Candidatus Planktophila sp.]|nr:WYL domain-containing protein [Candidatus Planktophila sp.]
MHNSNQTPLSRTARLLDLVPYVASHQGIEIAALAQNFNVTQPQIISDLTTLWMCGLPGYTHLELMDLSFDSGFVTIHNAQTLSNPRSLNSEETIALLLGLDLVIESLPTERSDLRDRARALVEKLSARISINAKLTAIPSAAGSVRALIEDALTKDSWVEITYHSSYSDTVSTRLIHPLELQLEGGYEYLWAICHSARGLRVFKMDRIQKLVPSPPPEAPLYAVDNQAEKTVYVIRVHTRPRAAMERFSLDRDSLSRDNEILSFSSEWVMRSIMASSGSVEVLEPSGLRIEIVKSAQGILDRYNGH